MAINPDFRDLFAALNDAGASFGAPTTSLEEADLAHAGTVFQIGVAPNRIDIITAGSR